MKAEVISPSLYNPTFPISENDDILRVAHLETIERLFKDGSDVVFVEAPSGYGKTRIVKQFIESNFENTVGYFVNVIDKHSSSRECLNSALYSQIYFLINNNEDLKKEIPDNFILQLRNDIDKKIRAFHSKKKFLYFAFDGFHSLSKQSIEIFKEVLADLPWGKIKFLFSGDSSSLLSLLPDKNRLKYKSLQVIPFNKDETANYLKNITKDSKYIDDVFQISSNGSVQCFIDDLDALAKLQENQKITVYGKCDGLMMNVLMKNCKLVDNLPNN